MESFIEVLFRGNKFLHIVARSVVITVLTIATGYEYYQSMQGNILSGVVFSLTLFSLVYFLYLKRKLKHDQRT